MKHRSAPPVRPEPVEGLMFVLMRHKRRRQGFDKLSPNGVGVALSLFLLVALPACSLRPLYSGGAQGIAAQTLAGVAVAPIEGKAGWLLRNALNDRLAASQGAETRYRLEVELDDQITGFGVRRDDAVTRERRALRARYRLMDAAQGTVLLDATAGSDVGIDVVSSEFATVAAEDTALERLTQTVADQIIARIALFGRRAPSP